MKSFNEIYEKIKGSDRQRVIAVAAAEDEPVLKAVAKAKELGLCNAVLVGDEEKILSLLSEH